MMTNEESIVLLYMIGGILTALYSLIYDKPRPYALNTFVMILQIATWPIYFLNHTRTLWEEMNDDN